MTQPGKIEIKLENKTLAISRECGTWDGRAFYPEYDYFLYSDSTVEQRINEVLSKRGTAEEDNK